MKLRNKKTGEIVEWFNNTDGIFPDSLAELNAEWEDAPGEPKEYYWIRSGIGDICKTVEGFSPHDEYRKQIGNYFETKEEAEKAVEKLKAWTRLKDRGFKFEWWKEADNRLQYNTIAFNSFAYNYEDRGQLRKDLDLLFSGGEE